MVEAAGERGEGNVRTPSSCRRLLAVLDETGWQASVPRTIDTTGVHDVAREITACHQVVKERLHTVPTPMRDLIQGHVDVLEMITPNNGALPVYSVTATR